MQMAAVNPNTQHQLKNDYLTAMGVTPWYPRVILANALSPLQQPTMIGEPDKEAQPVIPLVELASSTVTTPSAQLNPHEHSSVRPSEMGTASELNRPVAASAVLPASVTDNTAAIRFGLGIYVLGDWLVVSSLVTGHEQTQDVAFRLIANLLKAMTGNQYEFKHHHEIAWPFFSNANAEQGLDAAKHYVLGVLQQHAETHQTTHLLVLGGVLSKLNGWEGAHGTELGMQRLVLPSVYRMISEPMEKAKAWQLIRAAGLGQ